MDDVLLLDKAVGVEDACEWSIGLNAWVERFLAAILKLDDCSAEKLKVSYASHLKK